VGPPPLAGDLKIEITGPEADELYARQVERRPGFAEYKQKTSRWIPVIALEPVT
jgi:steroid 5-alpha reductase family enzyme